MMYTLKGVGLGVGVLNVQSLFFYSRKSELRYDQDSWTSYVYCVFSCRCLFWKNLSILITRVGKTSRKETHKRLQNLKEK